MCECSSRCLSRWLRSSLASISLALLCLLSTVLSSPAMAQDGKEVGGEEDPPPPPEIITAPSLYGLVCTYWREVGYSSSGPVFGAAVTGVDAAYLGGAWSIRGAPTSSGLNQWALERLNGSGNAASGTDSVLPGSAVVYTSSGGGLMARLPFHAGSFSSSSTSCIFTGVNGLYNPNGAGFGTQTGPGGFYRVSDTVVELRVASGSWVAAIATGSCRVSFPFARVSTIEMAPSGTVDTVIGRWEISSEFASALVAASGGTTEWQEPSDPRQTYQQLLAALGVPAPVGSSTRSVRKSILGDRSVIWRNDVEQPSGEADRFWFKLPKLPTFPDVPVDGPVLPLRITIPALPGTTGPAWDFDEDLTFTWYKPIRPWVAAGLMILVCYACVARIFAELSGRGKDG